MIEILEALFHRRAVKVFEPVEIPRALREQILDAARHAPSSFNSQPYQLFWVESPERKATAAKLCMGQKPAETASALVVAVADIGSLAETSRAQVEWMRASGFSYDKVRDYERTAKIGRILFHARAVWHFWRGQMGDFSTGEFVEDHGDAAPVSTGRVKVGDEKYIVGLRESDDRRRSDGTQYLSHGRI